ncbi:MAG TPA: family 1 glycosylhydrolase [Jiangellaceae bacterium]|nr:family 1 glycosylhydrolase [Jiangellaceae bacterium]
MTRKPPPGFLWGAATAAFQIEGSTAADGRSDSIWDVFCRRPGAIIGGDTGEPAIDHYRRMAGDVALMAELGLRSYRFSVAWPRVRPGGGPVNEPGLDFYRRLVDELLAHDIVPWVTLYHWDLPQALEHAGGWPARDTAYRFAEYADTVYAALGDRVSYWTTFNEPFCSALLGYASGEHAPGRSEPNAAVAAVHHLLLAHGLGVQAMRARNPEANVGITLNFAPVVPLDPDDPDDVEAARHIDGLQNLLFIEPVLRGAYAPGVLSDLAPYGLVDHIRDGDLDVVSAPVDMLGVNYYLGNTVSVRPPVPALDPDIVMPRPPGSPWIGAEEVTFHKVGRPVTGQGWEIYPEGLTDLLTWLHKEYPGMPMYVTENGAAFPDRVVDGRVHDPDRLAYLASHLDAVFDAIDAGADVRGYFYWSMFDNFEWAWGYGQRFGLVYVDFETQQRIVKSSGRWYAEAIASSAGVG